MAETKLTGNKRTTHQFEPLFDEDRKARTSGKKETRDETDRSGRWPEIKGGRADREAQKKKEKRATNERSGKPRRHPTIVQ